MTEGATAVAHRRATVGRAFPAPRGVEFNQKMLDELEATVGAALGGKNVTCVVVNNLIGFTTDPPVTYDELRVAAVAALAAYRTGTS